MDLQPTFLASSSLTLPQVQGSFLPFGHNPLVPAMAALHLPLPSAWNTLSSPFCLAAPAHHSGLSQYPLRPLWLKKLSPHFLSPVHSAVFSQCIYDYVIVALYQVTC